MPAEPSKVIHELQGSSNCLFFQFNLRFAAQQLRGFLARAHRRRLLRLKPALSLPSQPLCWQTKSSGRCKQLHKLPKEAELASNYSWAEEQDFTGLCMRQTFRSLSPAQWQTKRSIGPTQANKNAKKTSAMFGSSATKQARSRTWHARVSGQAFRHVFTHAICAETKNSGTCRHIFHAAHGRTHAHTCKSWRCRNM